jgi:hypothetical protein
MYSQDRRCHTYCSLLRKYEGTDEVQVDVIINPNEASLACHGNQVILDSNRIIKKMTRIPFIRFNMSDDVDDISPLPVTSRRSRIVDTQNKWL